ANVDSVYALRDEFVTKRGLSAAPLRDAAVEAYMKETLTQLDSLAQHSELQSGASLGRVCYERGRLLSVCPGQEAQAEQYLGRASKFNIPGAWTLLGECLYNRGDLAGATTCFNRTLTSGEDKVALRNLSMLMRAMPATTPQQRENNINKGVEYARRAVKQDPADGRSWMVLGNALLSAFFAVHANTTTLQACRAAYARAEQDKNASVLPELHYSKFQVWWYEEQYSAALASIRTACLLEPSWQECRAKLQHSTTFLRSLVAMVAKHGQLNPKRVSNISKSIKSIHLGPYERGGTALTNDVQPQLVTFQQLKPGTNTDKIVQGIVASTLVPESGIPFVMCLVDAEGTCLPVTVYNWAPGSEVKIGDAVAVLAPVLRIQILERACLNDSVELPNGETLDLKQQEIRPSANEDYLEMPTLKNLNVEADEKEALEGTSSRRKSTSKSEFGAVKLKADDASKSDGVTVVENKNSNEESACDRTKSDDANDSKCSEVIDESSAMSCDDQPCVEAEITRKDTTPLKSIKGNTLASVSPGSSESRKRTSAGRRLPADGSSGKANLKNLNKLSKTDGSKKTNDGTPSKTAAYLPSSSDKKTQIAAENKNKSSSTVSSASRNITSRINATETRAKISPKKQTKNDAKIQAPTNSLVNKNLGISGNRGTNSDRSGKPIRSGAGTSNNSSNVASNNRITGRAKPGRGKSATETSEEPSAKIELRNIRVVAPVMLVVNKRQVTSGQVAASYIVSQNKPE
ncbi:tetratricopeptide repeat protein 5, partial [Hyalella azteca]|uniref:Tetratricopeptide repeat protein 5 n=1 Tax=Hyalella azteca TaxID=294128 RepID=A0A8B7PGC3_HYAAZ